LWKKLPYDAELEDLESAARLGLLEAARIYDPTYQVTFPAFAVQRMKWAILAAARAHSGLPTGQHATIFLLRSALAAGALSQASVELAELKGKRVEPQQAAQELDGLLASYVTASALSLINQRRLQEFQADRHHGDGGGSSPEDVAREAQGRRLLEQCLQRLNERERRIVTAVYFEDRSLRDVATELGCDQGWVCRILHRAIQKMKTALQSEGVHVYPV
jgi:RNA polymerase sigma factor for flagellar operon FliA